MGVYGGITTKKPLEEMTDAEFSDFQNKVDTLKSRENALRGSSPPSSRANQTNTSSSSSSNLFGLGGDFGSLTEQAKDLARFRLGLDKDQAEFSFGLRDKEAEGNFGRQFKLDTQQRQFDRDINTDTQSAMTQRLEKELTNRLEQQERGINQENFATGRAIRLASRRLGDR